MTTRMLKKTLIVAVLTAALSGAYSIAVKGGVWDAYAAPGSVAAAVALPDMSEIVARNSPAVVNISMSGKVKNPNAPDFPGLDPSDPFYEFFRHFGVPQQRGEQGIGSALVLDSPRPGAADGVRAALRLPVEGGAAGPDHP